MSDLRTGLVEAMALNMHFADEGQLSAAQYRAAASVVLDAALGFLTDNAEAWPCHEDTDGLDCICIPELVAALLDSRDTGEEETPT